MAGDERGPRKRSAAQGTGSAQPAAAKHMLPERRSSGQRREGAGRCAACLWRSPKCTEAELEEPGEEGRRSRGALSSPFRALLLREWLQELCYAQGLCPTLCQVSLCSYPLPSHPVTSIFHEIERDAYCAGAEPKCLLRPRELSCVREIWSRENSLSVTPLRHRPMTPISPSAANPHPNIKSSCALYASCLFHIPAKGHVQLTLSASCGGTISLSPEKRPLLCRSCNRHILF